MKSQRLLSSTRTAPCDLCQSASFEVLSDADRRGGRLTSVVCTRCGLVSHGTIPSDRALRAYYEAQYRAEYHGETLPSAHRVVREWRRGAGLLDLISPWVNQGGKVLEVGSGIGCTVKHFQLAGYEATGIEPGEGFRRFSRTRLHAKIGAAELAELPPAGDQDLVLLVHVLEHLPSPTDALCRIARLLRPGGKLYVEVPNLAAPHAAPGKGFHRAHIYNFTPSTLAALANRCGFELIKQFSADREKNLAMLLIRSDQCRLHIERDSYQKTLAAVSRYNTITYHLRLRYLADRLRSVLRHVTDRMGAERRLRKILDTCSRAPGPAVTGSQPTRRAA